MRYLVLQRRMLVEAMRTQALMTAYVNPEQASSAAKQYLELAVPTDPEVIEAAERAREEQMAEIAKMKPIPLSQIHVGNRIGGSPGGSF